MAVVRCGAGTEGNNPVDPMLSAGSDLFVESRQGGAWARGTILKLAGDGAGYVPVVLHAFSGALFGDGASPTGGLSADSAGNLYGTTERGGAADAGTVFKLRKTAGGYSYSILYSFSGGADGSAPLGVVSDAAGHLFGIVQAAGSGGAGGVFALSGGQFSFLHRFSSLAPTTPLAFDGGSNMFGTWGNTVFRISTSGAYSELRVLSGSDGSAPLGRVAVDAGVVFGTTSSTIFSISGSGSDFRVLGTFGGEGGQSPSGPVAFDASGSLVCAMSSGGIPGVDFGTLVHMGKDGSTFAVVHSFAGELDGSVPLGGLTREGAGSVVGATAGGGALGGGVVFRIEAQPPAIAISPSVLPDGATAAPYPKTQFTASGGAGPYRFGQSGDAHFVGVPPGLTLTDGGVLAGIPYQEGQWSFAISAEDVNGFVDSRTYTVTIAKGVAPIPPVASSSSVVARSGVSTRIVLSGSDPTHSAPDFRFEITSQPRFGTLSNFSQGDGEVDYAPLPGFVGDDSFTFVTHDEFGISSVATLRITVVAPSVVVVPSPMPVTISGH